MNFLEIFRNLMARIHPELTARTHVPVRARVLAVHGESGDVQPTSGPRRYSVDVQPIRDDGTDDPDRAVLVDVALPVQWAGSERGIFCLPAVGSVCLIGFVDGNAGFPYVHSILPDGWKVPAIEAGEMIIQHSPGHTLKWDVDGDLHIDTKDLRLYVNGNLTSHCTGDATLSADGTVHLGGAGGQPVIRDGDTVYVHGFDSRGDEFGVTVTLAATSTKVRAT